MEEAFVQYMLANTGISGLVNDRITWAARPQASQLPSIVLHKITGAPEYADEGEVALFSARVQIDCWGLKYSDAKNVSRAVMDLLSGSQFESQGINFHATFNEDEQDSRELAAANQELYRVRLDYIVWHS